MRDDTKVLVKKSFGNAVSVAGYVSTASTFLPIMLFLHPYLRTFGVCLIIVGIFWGARSVIAQKSEQLAVAASTMHRDIETLRAEKNAEIAALNERIAELSRRPYTEELRRITTQVLNFEMTLEGRHVLRHLMIHAPVEVGRVFIPEIPQERQHAQLGIAMRQGVVQHQVENQGLRRTYWIINPRFRPVLEDVLYQDDE